MIMEIMNAESCQLSNVVIAHQQTHRDECSSWSAILLLCLHDVINLFPPHLSVCISGSLNCNRTQCGAVTDQKA